MSMMGDENYAKTPPEPDSIPAPMGVEPEKIERERPSPDPARSALVSNVVDWVRKTKNCRKKTFDRMRRDMDFSRPGHQWKAVRGLDTDSVNTPYEANLIQRHIQQRTAALYAKNPTFVAKRRKRLDFELWDGEQKSLEEALARVKGSPGDPMTGAPPVPPMPTPDDIELLKDVEQGMARRRMLDRLSKTLEILFRYYIQEGTPSFKLQAKQLIRRVEATGVGIVQLGFQRLMRDDPEVTSSIRDNKTQLDKMRVLAADQRDGINTDMDKQIEELRLGLEALQKKQQIVLREGLIFDFPHSTDIIVDRDCIQLKGLVGAHRVAREYHYTKDQIKAIFRKDIGDNYTQYDPNKTWEAADTSTKKRGGMIACVYGVWDIDTGLVYWVCDGYPDFLQEPSCPEVEVEGFFPFYFLTFNDLEDPNDIYPASDVQLLRSMQLEYNRAREGLREHRIANKPGYVGPKGLLDDEDKKNLENHAPNEYIELNITPQQVQDINKLIAPRPTVKIQPEIYDTEYVFTDIQRVSGDQEANFGGTSGSTATEASIAESTRVSTLQSNTDDLDDLLSAIARDGGQILLMEMTVEQVMKIVGPGAVWPEMSREELSEEIYLEIQGGSSGRPNKALEIANMERLAPMMLQMRGINPEWLLRQMMTRLDETADLEDAFMPGVPSVVAQNTIDGAAGKQLQPGTGNPKSDPGAQGPKGAENAGPAGVPDSQPGPRPDYPVITH